MHQAAEINTHSLLGHIHQAALWASLPVALAALGLLAFPSAAAADHGTPVYYQLVLEDAAYHPGSDRGRVLVVDLERLGEHWGAAYGVARDYNMVFHRGAVVEAEETGEGLTLELAMSYTADPWIPGGEGRYSVELMRDEQGDLAGSFEGTFNTRAVSGKAHATVYAPQVADDHRRLEPQEHPRLLFRKEDLPALRERFGTPFGRAARQRLENADTPAAYGLLYQLTGDESYVKKGLELANRELDKPHRGGHAFRPLAPLGLRLEQLALFYDLCHDALPHDYKARYRAWAGDLGHLTYFATEALGRTNWHVVSNHVADVYAGLTMTALVLYDVPSDAPERPSEPFLEETLPPAEDFEPAPDVPVVELEPGRSPDRWLHTVPFYRVTPDDPREVFYGLEEVHPTPGTKVGVGEFELTFREQDPATRVGDGDEEGGLRVYDLLDADAAARLREPFTMVGYTVVRVTEPGRYHISAPCSRANLMQVAMNGQLLAGGQVVRLEEGLYPLTVMVQWRMRWGRIAPTISRATEEQAEQWRHKTERICDQHKRRMLTYENVKATWQRTGGDPAFARLLRLSRFTSSLHNTHAVGRGGFQGEVGHYSIEAMRGHARLWPAWRRVTGYDITPGDEYPDVIPRKIIGGPQDINGTTRIGGDYFSALFPVVRRQWQPDVLTAWHREMGVEGDETVNRVLRADPVRAFINYPLDMEPAPIGTNLPRYWEAPDFGYYAFRSDWGDDAFVAQVFLKSRIISGWHGGNAGTFRLRGLERNWAVGPTDRVRRRQQENIVWMPEAELWDTGLARLTYLHADDDTLVLSADMDMVYERQGRLAPAPYGHVVQERTDEEAPEPSGITGMRSLAFDYSGVSGSPCVFVIVDRIDGGEDVRRFWLFQPPVAQGAQLSDVVGADEDGGFVVRPGEASPTLHGRFAHPRRPEINTEPLTYEYVKTWGQQRGQTHSVNVNAITVPGRDHFFFVGTVTDGAHPEVHVEGDGLNAVITVGDRTVRFDGEKIILGTR